MRLPAASEAYASVFVLAISTNLAAAQQVERTVSAVDAEITVDGARLYSRVVGRGFPVIVLHGGPDFDHNYLLPDLDQFQDLFRLIYYDQRGRGRSADRVRADDVTLASDLADLDEVRQHFALDAPILLGHSWGAVLALEYALRHPDRVSRLILMNPAPVSAGDLEVLRTSYLEKLGPDMDRQREIVSSAAYQAGDPAAVTARYRIHFKPALARSQDYERLMAAMEASFIEQGPQGIVKARAIEERLMRDTWDAPDYDLLPSLRGLLVPTLVINGEHDFIPVAIGANIARAIPGATLMTIEGCGHFAYLECATSVRRAFDDFFRPRE
jgi:proline iminopeptidase